MTDVEASRVGATGIAFLFLHALYIPWAAIRSGRKIAQGMALPSKPRYFAFAIVQLGGLAALSLYVAHEEWVELFPAYSFQPSHALYGLAALTLFVGFMRSRWRTAVERGNRKLHFFSPEGGRERALWVGVCVCAGIGEEITYRGVLYALCFRLFGHVAAAALASALVFGAAHMLQGWKSAAAIVGFALVFQALVFATGSLYVAMLVHVVYDLIAGFTYGRLLREKRAREAAAVTSAAT